MCLVYHDIALDAKGQNLENMVGFWETNEAN